MPQYEYRVIAAPTRGVRTKGISSAEARFSHALEEMMNTMASEGWEYQRAETLPSVERTGLASTATMWRNVLVFRRIVEEAAETTAAKPDVLRLDDPIMIEPAEAQPAPASRPVPPPIVSPQTPEDDASQSLGASRMLSDNGVEELSEVSGISSSLLQLAAARNANKTDD